MISLVWGYYFSWFFWMVVDYHCSYLWHWELRKPWMLCTWMNFVLEELWSCMVFAVILEYSSVVLLFPLLGFFPRPAHKSLWWMEISWWPRGSGLPLHMLWGGRGSMWWGIEFCIIKMILELFFSAPLLWICGPILGVDCQSEIWLGSAKGWVEHGSDDTSCALIR